MGISKKLGISIGSLILVVGAVIGVIAVVKSTGNVSSEKKVLVSMKTLDLFCAAAIHKGLCTRSLDIVTKNQTANPKDFVMAIIQSTLGEFRKSFSVTGSIVINKETDPYNYMAIEDCKDLLDQAMDMLQASYSMVSGCQLKSLQERAYELRSWLTAVFALQSTCTDQIEKPEYKSAMENGIMNATLLTRNAINILFDISGVFKAFDLPLNFKAGAGVSTSGFLGVGNFPSWFKAPERRLLRGGHHLKPNVVVAKDGSGQFTKIEDAINSYPKDHQGRFSIHVKAGVYEEFIVIDKKKPDIMIYGDGPGKTIVTGTRNFGIMKIGTMHTATFSSNAPGFIARQMTFRNEAGPEGHQAVALRINGDRSVIYNCHIEGYQDTLYYHSSRQFYRDCVISGTIDFIFGRGDAIIQNSLIIVRKPNANQLNTITADGKELERGTNGLILQNCRIVPEKELEPVKFQIASYFGRPWKAHALTVVMQSEIGDFIRPEGWVPWTTTDPAYFHHNTCNYYEYENRGPGAATDKRSKEFKNFKILSQHEAIQYTAGEFLLAEQWLKGTKVPFQLGLE